MILEILRKYLIILVGKLNFDFSVLCTFEIESCYKRKRGFRFLSFAAKPYFELRIFRVEKWAGLNQNNGRKLYQKLFYSSAENVFRKCKLQYDSGT